jgi:hypothetical protein
MLGAPLLDHLLKRSVDLPVIVHQTRKSDI